MIQGIEEYPSYWKNTIMEHFVKDRGPFRSVLSNTHNLVMVDEPWKNVHRDNYYKHATFAYLFAGFFSATIRLSKETSRTYLIILCHFHDFCSRHIS